ncbi:Ger(x)C family spore germination protein [Metabacillus fastidiosus]|uniref:Ger(x)C family spore germination protein n=1 Tax=Metabacillus fastidiosus TaxID=1458 RepID=UPI002E220357|nr:Ger(x)C family spore germination protein [Metabacillus fastidiosus]MED4452514.1 Ger(x)C family spore germination protein [Metabacillus fastidiosus]
MKYSIIICCLIFCALSGCVEQEIIDDINLVTTAGFDKKEGEEKYTGMVLIPQFLKDQPVQEERLTGESLLSREILSEIERESSRPLAIGKIKLVLFSEELARQGVKDFMDPLQRDESIGSRVLLAITRGDAADIMSEQLGLKGTSTYLTSLILHNKEQRDVPTANLHLFLNNYKSAWSDSYLPFLKKKDDGVIIDGLALFNGDKLVGEIPNEKLFSMKILTDSHTSGNYMLRIPETDELVSIYNIHSSRKIRAKQLNPLKASVDIKMKGAIQQYTGRDLTKEDIYKIEKALEKDIKKEVIALFEKFQELNIDPVRLGREIKAYSREFDLSEWRKRKEDYSVIVNVEAVISETGVTE